MAGIASIGWMVAAGLFLLLGQPSSIRVSPRSAPLQSERAYDNGLLLLRPEHASSQYEMGFLPGDYESKVSPWLEPFFQAIRSFSIHNDHDFMADL
ncbi:MAG: hypothetical protein R6X15_10470, partial [Pseudomonadota bacterium]